MGSEAGASPSPAGGQVLAIGLTHELTCPSRPLLGDASAEGVPCGGDSPRLEEVHVGQAGREGGSDAFRHL